MDSIQINYDTKSIVKKIKEIDLMPDDAIGMFMIKDCILIQIYTGKTFTYRVINFMSGDVKYLFHRKNEITKDDYEAVAVKIMALPFYNMKRAKNGIEMIDYIFKEVFTKCGYKVREEQVNLSKHMFNAMKEAKISMSDIAVGLGKTHAYLVAAIVHNIYVIKNVGSQPMPIIISTSSIELQRAIVKDYIPDISKMLYENGIISTPITCVLRKGKENYLCENRLKDYVNTLDLKWKKENEYRALEELMLSTTIDLDEVKDISNYDKRKISVKSINCYNCKKYRSCRYQKFMINARKSHHYFQICNHNYYLADILKRKKGLVSLLPEHKTVIIDEAHKLIVVSQQMYGANISQNEINNIIKKVLPKNGTSRAKKISKKLCNEVLKCNKLLFEELINQIPKELYGSDTEKFKTAITSRAKMLLNRMIVNSSDLFRNISYKDRKLLSDVKRIIENMKVFTHAENIYWLEKPSAKGQSIFLSIPKKLNEEICKDLWSLDKSMLLTSGTIAVDDDFDYMKKELGLDIINRNRIVEISKGSPFDFKKNCMMYISNNVPFPNTDDENYIKKVTNEIYKLIKASNGHAMVLFTSYKPLRKVYKNLSEQITDIPLIEMSRGRSSAVLEFKESKNGVLFATGSMWEGVNIPGDILSHLIIVKLPFPIPDPISEYEKTLYRDMDHYRNSVLVPKMLIKLRQGAGRLIRSEADTGVISILDIRSSNKGKYHQEIINALPECVVAEEIDDIEGFIRNKKDKTYFE